MKPKPQLLIVDNHISMLRLLSNVLSGEYEIVAKLNPIEAYSWLQEGHYPDLTIIASAAANMAEFSLVKNLRISGMYRNMPIVLIKPEVRSVTQNADNEKGVRACVQSPFNPGKLKETLRQIMATGISTAA